jgi:hypothetical protein
MDCGVKPHNDELLVYGLWGQATQWQSKPVPPHIWPRNTRNYTNNFFIFFPTILIDFAFFRARSCLSWSPRRCHCRVIPLPNRNYLPILIFINEFSTISKNPRYRKVIIFIVVFCSSFVIGKSVKSRTREKIKLEKQHHNGLPDHPALNRALPVDTLLPFSNSPIECWPAITDFSGRNSSPWRTRMC